MTELGYADIVHGLNTTSCKRCKGPLADDERWVCASCDAHIMDLQDKFKGDEFLEKRALAYRSANIPYEMLRLRVTPTVRGALAKWQAGDIDHLYFKAEPNDSEALNRRWDMAAAVYGRMRGSSRIVPGRIVFAEKLAMLPFEQLDAAAEELTLIPILAIDIPGAKLNDHVMARIFALISARHWSGVRPRPTLVGVDSGAADHEVVREIIGMMSEPKPTGEQAIPVVKLSPRGMHEQACAECGRPVFSKHPSSAAWLCHGCSTGGE